METETETETEHPYIEEFKMQHYFSQYISFSSLLLLLLLLIFHSQNVLVLANTEKVIFLGPEKLDIPLEHPTLEDLYLESLSPQHSVLRTHIEAEFPTNQSIYGRSSWYLLNRLKDGQRYEVRICWAATEPTSFRLETYELPTVFEHPELITSLAHYSESNQPLAGESKSQTPQIERGDASSTLFLQIYAAADYYTMNSTLMSNVPPVFVDIILDPYIFNIVPRSLVPTAAYIILLAVGSWYISKYIMEWIRNVGEAGETYIEKKKS